MQFEKDLSSPHFELFEQARAVLVDEMKFIETKKPRITIYSDSNGGVCHMRTMPHGIDFGFLEGAKMHDELGMLTGNGKSMRVLPMSQMDQDVLKYYLAQAIQLNQKS